jgi:hypothetical protein
MPISIITVTPVSATVVTAGATPVSGTPSGFAGPWAVETQTLSITYCRVPSQMAVSGGTQVLSLSADNVRTTVVQKTTLNYIINATYTLFKDYNTYPTSGHQQPQTFTILSDADPFGNEYGTYTSSTNKYNLGPAGTVVTVQPYIRRVPWDDNIHTATAKSITGASFLYTIADGSKLVGYSTPNQTFNNFNMALGGFTHTFQNPQAAFMPTANATLTQDTYPIFGGYSRAKESDARFANWLNLIGDNIATTRYFRTDIAKDIDWSWNGSTLNFITNTNTWYISLPEYSSDRHQY